MTKPRNTHRASFEFNWPDTVTWLNPNDYTDKNRANPGLKSIYVEIEDLALRGFIQVTVRVRACELFYVESDGAKQDFSRDLCHAWNEIWASFGYTEDA